jgi:hypothetical protein
MMRHGGVPTDALLRRHGYLRVSTAEAPSAQQRSSTPEDVRIPTPIIAFDLQRMRYTASATYQWNCGSCWENTGGNIGGPDGFGFSLSRAVTNQGTTGQFSGKPGLAIGTTVLSNTARNNQYGVAYKLQDWEVALPGNRLDYNTYSGAVTMDMARPCGETQIFSKVFHTWDTTALTGVDIGIFSIGAQWSTTAHHWQAVSQAGTLNVDCNSTPPAPTQPAPTIRTISTDIVNGSRAATFHMNFEIGNQPLTTWSCTLDGATYACPNPFSVSIGPVAYSGHSFRITVQNYGGTATTGADWVGGA